MTEFMIKRRYVGKCRVTNRLLSYPDDAWIRFSSELLCHCHNQFVQHMEDISSAVSIEERDDGLYWVERVE